MASSSSSSSVRNTGMTVLFEPKDSLVIADIVFVHGLQGHPKDTWTAKYVAAGGANSTPIEQKRPNKRWKFWSKAGPSESAASRLANDADTLTFWPYHLLPDDLKNARILTWGYNSTVSQFFNGSANKGTILSHSRDLLGDLIGERLSHPNRKLIFVAHSLGGIIVKAMLLRAGVSDKERERSIYESTNAILFLGTPHRGGNFADLGETARRIASAVGFDTNSKNINDLAIDSSALEDYHERFLNLYNKRKFEVCTFQEARGVKGTSLLGLNQQVVDNVSSTFTGTEPRYAIDANHMEMCRFASKEDDGYRKVSRELCVLCGDIEKTCNTENPQAMNATHRAYIASLAFPEMNYRQEEVLEARSDSCGWIFQHQNYQTWLTDNHGLLWIQGKPGSGKSTLMKRIFQTLCDDSITGRIYLSFFFHRRGTPLQHTPLGMFRTMLYQLLSQVPSAGADFWKLCEEKRNFQGEDPKIWEWREAELGRVLKSSLILAAKTQSIMIFADALDEAGEDSARYVVSYLYELNEQLTQSNYAVKICFACRYHPVVKTTDGIEIRVDDKNSKDISSYAFSELKRLIQPRMDDDLVVLQTRLAQKASGVFLWVSLVIPKIAKQYNDGRSMEEVVEILEKTPPDLKEVYKHILGLIEPSFRRQTLHLMEWICLAVRPLSLTELRYALAMDDSSIHEYQESAQESAGFVESDERMKDLAVGLSGGLAEVKVHWSERIVQFIHQSVNDFLLKEGLTWLDEESKGNAIGRGHDRITRSCVNYLKLGEVGKAASFCPYPGRDEIWALQDNLPFLEYSTTSWFLHAESAETRDTPQYELIRRFQWPTAQYFSNWVKLFNEVDRNDPGCPQYEAKLIHVAAASNLGSIVKELLESQTPVDLEDGVGNLALHRAARWGHTKIVLMLLDAGTDVNAGNNNRDTPLELAAAHGHSEIVKLLLENGAEVNQETGEYGNALEHAAYKGRWRTVKLLLDSGADVNAQGGYYGNALQAAAYKGHETIVKLLLDNRADINAQGGKYCNALQAAACPGRKTVIKLLLDNGANVNAQGGYYGNALQEAAHNGHETIVKLLLDNGANVNAQGGKYGNALQAAAHGRHETIAKLLLGNGANINAKDQQGRFTLHIAMGNNQFTLIKYLLSAGAQADWTYADRRGCSALHFAASGGSIEALELILKSGVEIDIDMPDSQGWTPLHWASRHGSLEAVEFLVDAGADLQKTNMQSWTPLDVAVFCGRDSLVSVLSGSQDPAKGRVKQTISSAEFKIFSNCDSCFLSTSGTDYVCDNCEYYFLCFRCIEDSAVIHDPTHKFTADKRT